MKLFTKKKTNCGCGWNSIISSSDFHFLANFWPLKWMSSHGNANGVWAMFQTSSQQQPTTTTTTTKTYEITFHLECVAIFYSKFVDRRKKITSRSVPCASNFVFLANNNNNINNAKLTLQCDWRLTLAHHNRNSVSAVHMKLYAV